MNSILSPDAGKLWLLAGLCTIFVFVPIWVGTTCIYDPRGLPDFMKVVCNSLEHPTPAPIGVEKRGKEEGTRNKRNIQPRGSTEGVSFWFNSSGTAIATFSFDYCNIVKCPQFPWQCNMYRDTPTSRSFYLCVTDEYYGNKCGSWGAVGWNTGNDWGYRPQSALDRRDKYGKSLISRMTLSKGGTCSNFGKTGSNMPLILSIENPQPTDAGLYILGVWIKGGSTGNMGKIQLKDMAGSEEWAGLQDTGTPTAAPGGEVVNIVAVEEEEEGEEHGYANMWIKWLNYTVRAAGITDCIACAQGRPRPLAVPLKGLNVTCILAMMKNESAEENCVRERKLFPPTTQKGYPTGIIVTRGNYTCWAKSSGTSFRHCSRTNTVNDTDPLYGGTGIKLADIWWVCGNNKIRPTLSAQWKGTCTMIRLIVPMTIMEVNPSFHRARRGVSDETQNDQVYIDAIGVPRGVPNEYKALDEVASGFASIIPQISINKNTAWINYIYYNQQRFVNYTRDAVQGLAEQLAPTSQMAFDNRLALDMILAEKGGVCKMIGSECCTYIPNNTAPYGTVSRALKQLESLSKELKENSGVTDPWSQYFGWITNWKQALIQFCVVILMILVVLVVTLYCIIPCFKRLMTKGVKNVVVYNNSAEGHQKYLEERGARMQML